MVLVSIRPSLLSGVCNRDVSHVDLDLEGYGERVAKQHSESKLRCALGRRCLSGAINMGCALGHRCDGDIASGVSGGVGNGVRKHLTSSAVAVDGVP